MTTLVRIELLKLRTTPAVYVALAIAFFLTVASVLTTILLAGQPGTSPVGSVENVSHVLAIGVVTSFSMLILGMMISAGEDRHRTSLGTYLAEPRRGRVLVAKLVTAALVGAVGGRRHLRTRPGDRACPCTPPEGCTTFRSTSPRCGTGTTLLTACFGLLGVALGALTRNTVAAIIGALVWVGGRSSSRVLQPLFPSLAKWLPTGAARRPDHGHRPQRTCSHRPSPPLVLVGWAAVAGPARRPDHPPPGTALSTRQARPTRPNPLRHRREKPDMTTTHTTTTGRRRLRQVVADHPVTSFSIMAFAIGWPLLVIRTTTGFAPHRWATPSPTSPCSARPWA